MKNNNRNIYVLIILILAISLIVWFFILNKNGNNIIWEHVSDKKFDQNIFREDINTKTWTNQITEEELKEQIKKENIDQINYDQIWSIIRAVCWNFTNIKDVVNSQSFLILKWKVDDISNNLNVTKDNFTYVILPWIVFSNCWTYDETYAEKLVKILQTNWKEIILSTKEELNWIYKFVDEIEFNWTNADKNIIKKSKEHFNKIFFQDNLKAISSSYFYENMYYLWDLEKYVYSSTMLSFDEANDILDWSVWKLQVFIKSLGFSDLKEFNKKILSFNWYSNVEEMKNDLVKKYDKLNEIAKNELDFYLNEKLISLDSLKRFYLSDNFSKLKDNKDAYELYKEIAIWHIHFAIITWDYANNLTEWWSWKAFFDDTLKWNWIIRLSYIYIYDQNK